ncbi:class I SAM-dependent methyltransferase [Propionicimonas sp.]|uniref:class I SAM-dependent methyltransferase n=1 Tax=Propionicimonas sp. TaxID=1955623 RepID=UPI0039E53419
MTATEFWDERYATRPKIWSGRANQALVDVATDLAPARALDLGCGEGGDAIWLAARGWIVTAVDISTIAVQRGRAAAASAGVPPARITWVAQDLAEGVPDGPYDLVTASFLQSPVELARTAILQAAAAAVGPGGHLLVVSHAAPPPWATQLDAHHHEFPTPASELAALGLSAEQWDVVVAEVRGRPATGPDGERARIDDTVVLVRRQAEPAGQDASPTPPLF